MGDMKNKFDMYDIKPDVTHEMIKTKTSNSSTRLEYLRMRQEQEVKRLQANASSFVYEEKAPDPRRASLAADQDALKEQSAEPEVKSFPFMDLSDRVNTPNSSRTALEAQEHPRHQHGAKLCMMSAMVHMKCLAQRRAKSIKQLRKNPRTSLDEMALPRKSSSAHVRGIHDHSDGTDEDDDSEIAKLRKCRYLRGVKEDKELSIEEIFG